MLNILYQIKIIKRKSGIFASSLFSGVLESKGREYSLDYGLAIHGNRGKLEREPSLRGPCSYSGSRAMPALPTGQFQVQAYR